MLIFTLSLRLACLSVCFVLASLAQLEAYASPVEASKPALALLPPQTIYNQNSRCCRVSMRVAEHCVELGEQDVEHYMKFGERNMESWRLEVTIENLGNKELVVYNPFFHPVATSPLYSLCHSAKLNLYDQTGKLRGDCLAWTGGSAVTMVARRWMSIPPGKSYTGSYTLRRNNPRLSKDSWRDGPFYLQAVFLERFFSTDPTGRPAPRINDDYSTPKKRYYAFGMDLSTHPVASIKLALPPEEVLKWLATTSGGACLRSNVVKIQFADREDVEPVP